MQADHEEFKLLATGAEAKGIIAVGGAAQGIVAIGANAMGIVAIGVNALGTLVAVGVNAVAPVALSAVNSIALLGLSLVNVIGGFGYGLVNELVHPLLALLLLAVMVFLGHKLGGRWQRPELPPLVPLDDLQAGRVHQGWATARLLAADGRQLVVGDSDGEVTLVASGKARQHASELLTKPRRRVLVHVEVTYEVDAVAAGDYRAAAERSAVLHADEVRTMPRRPPWPQHPDELRWVIAKSLWVVAALGLVLTGVLGLA